MQINKKRRSTKQPDPEALTVAMAEWPDSWAGEEKDQEPGKRLVAEFRPFVAHLIDSGLVARTVRRHVDWLWVIGGEIVRQFNYEPSLRRRSGRRLLLDVIDIGEAPLIRDATEAEQRSADATARKLLKFIRSLEKTTGL